MRLVIIFVVSFFVVQQSAYAGVIEVLSGHNGITIKEYNSDPNTLLYDVSNLSGQDIHAFGVSSNTYAGEMDNEFNDNTFTTFHGWTATQLSRSDWFTAIGYFQSSNEGYDLSFQTLFGNDNYINWYQLAPENGAVGISELELIGKFGIKSADASSEFIAFNEFNQVIDYSSTSQVKVPEPSTLAIFALGMMGLASRRFKKQA